MVVKSLVNNHQVLVSRDEMSMMPYSLSPWSGFIYSLFRGGGKYGLTLTSDQALTWLSKKPHLGMGSFLALKTRLDWLSLPSWCAFHAVMETMCAKVQLIVKVN